jgi:hypothetical protein
MPKFRGYGLIVALCLLLTVLLVACGDSPTATPAPATTAAATTAASTTSAAVATTAATTAAATTTAAAKTTAAATTAAATTAAATTAATSTGSLSLPVISGAKEVTLDPAVTGELAKQIPGLSSISGLVIKLFASDDADEKLAASTDTALTGAGYSFGLPGATKPSKQGDTIAGFYVKNGAPDILLAVGGITSDSVDISKMLDIPGLSKDAAEKMVSQIKGRKSFMLVIAGPNILQALLMGSSNASVTPGASATKTPVPTLASATGPGSELVGQLIAAGDNDIRVKNVVRFDELKSSGGKTATPKGVFLVIVLEVANLGSKPSGLTFVNLVDDKGRQFDTTSDGDAISAIVSKPEFDSSLLINPGFAGTEVKIYDVPKDATGFKLQPDDFLGKTERKASADSFSASGGKGPDSSAGPELVGKTFNSKDKVSATITKVERLNEISGSGKTFKTSGTFLIVQYDVKNDGDKPSSFLTFYLKDGQGHTFSSTSDFDLSFALGASGKYKNDLTINPGQSGKGYKVFEVTKEASAFDLVDIF